MALTEEDKKEIQLIVAKEIKAAFGDLANGLKKQGFVTSSLPDNVVATIETILDKRARNIYASIVEKTDPERAERIRNIDPKF